MLPDECWYSEDGVMSCYGAESSQDDDYWRRSWMECTKECSHDIVIGFALRQILMAPEMINLLQVYVVSRHNLDCRYLLLPFLVGKLLCMYPLYTDCPTVDDLSLLMSFFAVIASLWTVWHRLHQVISIANFMRLGLRSCRVLLTMLLAAIPFTVVLLIELTTITRSASTWVFRWIIRNQVQQAVMHFLDNHNVTEEQRLEINCGCFLEIIKAIDSDDMMDEEREIYRPICALEGLSLVLEGKPVTASISTIRAPGTPKIHAKR
jgi:hypothetical protein